LKKEVWNSGSLICEKYYAGSFVYNNEGIEYILFDEGRLTPKADGTYQYEYFLKDHLGNTRVVFTGQEEGLAVLQESHYYPFGMEFMGVGGEQMDITNYYKYNGKELQDDGFDLDGNGVYESRLLWYDYGARFYDAQLGRWHCLDPLTEKYSTLSPYNYVANNPVMFIDPDGTSITDFGVTSTGEVKQIGPKNDEPDRLFKIDADNNKVDVNNDKNMTEGTDYVTVNDKNLLPQLSKGEEVTQEDAVGTVEREGVLRIGASNNKDDMVKTFIFLAKNTNVEWSMFKEKSGNISLGTFQWDDLSPGLSRHGLDNTNIASMIHNHPRETTLKDEKASLAGDSKLANQVNYNYFVYMSKSSNLYQLSNNSKRATRSYNVNYEKIMNKF